MGLPKKAKGGSKNKSKGGKEEGDMEKNGKPKQPTGPQVADFVEPQVLPHERIAMVKPFWENARQAERLKLLSIPLSELKRRAAEVGAEQRSQRRLQQKATKGTKQEDRLASEPTVDELLSVRIQRLQENKTCSCKLWMWPPAAKEFLTAEEFELCNKEDFINENRRYLLSLDGERLIGKAAEQALRLRMTELLKRVDNIKSPLSQEQQGPWLEHTWRWLPRECDSSQQLQAAVHSSNVEVIHVIMKALEKEDESVVCTFLESLTTNICQLVPEDAHETSRVWYKDIEKLPASTVGLIAKRLTMKVLSRATMPPAEPHEAEQEAEEEALDVDHFILNEKRDRLQINPRWLQYLQERRLDEDGQPRKAEAGEDPHNIGLSLEYVFQTFVPTADFVHVSAQRCLGTKLAVRVHVLLVTRLEDMHTWKEHHCKAKEVLEEMLQSRSEVAKLRKKYDIRPTPTAQAPRTTPGIDGLPGQGSEAVASPADLPEHVIVAMLRREDLLTRAKLYALCYDQTTGERQLRKQLPQGTHDQRQSQEQDIARRGQEIKQMQGWAKQVSVLMSLLEETMEVLGIPNHKLQDGEEPKGLEPEQREHHLSGLPGRDVTDQAHALKRLSKLRAKFQGSVQGQLLSSKDDDVTIIKRIQGQQRDAARRLAEGQEDLFHLQNLRMNVACDDPGLAIDMRLTLPVLQEHLESMAGEFAESEVMRRKEDILCTGAGSTAVGQAEDAVCSAGIKVVSRRVPTIEPPPATALGAAPGNKPSGPAPSTMHTAAATTPS